MSPLRLKRLAAGSLRDFRGWSLTPTRMEGGHSRISDVVCGGSGQVPFPADLFKGDFADIGSRQCSATFYRIIVVSITVGDGVQRSYFLLVGFEKFADSEADKTFVSRGDALLGLFCADVVVSLNAHVRVVMNAFCFVTLRSAVEIDGELFVRYFDAE